MIGDIIDAAIGAVIFVSALYVLARHGVSVGVREIPPPADWLALVATW